MTLSHVVIKEVLVRDEWRELSPCFSQINFEILRSLFNAISISTAIKGSSKNFLTSKEKTAASSF